MERRLKQKADIKNIIPPQIEDIIEYCEGRNSPVNPNTFYNWYQERQWKVGKSKMTDWQAAIRTWERNTNNTYLNSNNNKKKYSTLLLDPRWQKKRLEIMQRDNFKCQRCDDDKSTLNVHHEYYDPEKAPWEYDDKFLHTLCKDCHYLEHNDIFTYPGEKIIYKNALNTNHIKYISAIPYEVQFFEVEDKISYGWKSGIDYEILKNALDYLDKWRKSLNING
jgi:5-methylcytosine-specific restriction endonuclease McrA